LVLLLYRIRLDHGEQVIAKMKHRGIRTVMLTGDAKQVAEPIAKRLGIDEVHAELLPGEKQLP